MGASEAAPSSSLAQARVEAGERRARAQAVLLELGGRSLDLRSAGALKWRLSLCKGGSGMGWVEAFWGDWTLSWKKVTSGEEVDEGGLLEGEGT